MFITEAKYNQHEYGEAMVEREDTVMTVQDMSRSRFDFKISKSIVESEESILGMNLFPPKRETFFQMQKEYTTSSVIRRASLFEIKFDLSNDVHYYNR